MGRIRVIFTQTIMISAAILFGIGVQTAILHFSTDYSQMDWSWYMPLSIILTGFLCSLPTFLLMPRKAISRGAMWTRIVLHFLCIGGVVSLCGYLFKWYGSLSGYLTILGMYVVIYIFVWFVMTRMGKADEKKINEAIKDLRDEE